MAFDDLKWFEDCFQRKVVEGDDLIARLCHSPLLNEGSPARPLRASKQPKLPLAAPFGVVVIVRRLVHEPMARLFHRLG